MEDLSQAINFVPFTYKYDDEGIQTVTSKNEQQTEFIIKGNAEEDEALFSEFHANYLNSIYKPTSTLRDESMGLWNPMEILFPSICLKSSKVEEYKQQLISYLQHRLRPGHLWTEMKYNFENVVCLYGAMIGLALIGTEEAYEQINQRDVYDILCKLKQPNGSFSTLPVEFSEFDLRSTFSALYIGWLCDVLTPDLTKGVIDFVHQCHNYDGGFAPLPGCEWYFLGRVNRGRK